MELEEEAPHPVDGMTAELGNSRRGVHIDVEVGIEQPLHVVEVFGQAEMNEEEGRRGMAAQQALGLVP